MRKIAYFQVSKSCYLLRMITLPWAAQIQCCSVQGEQLWEKLLKFHWSSLGWPYHQLTEFQILKKKNIVLGSFHIMLCFETSWATRLCLGFLLPALFLCLSLSISCCWGSFLVGQTLLYYFFNYSKSKIMWSLWTMITLTEWTQ